jgi:electron transfer flavoprotein alpha subunit
MVLVYIDSPKGQLKKPAFEAITYGSKIAQQLGTTCEALVIGNVANAGDLGIYGASKVNQISGDHPFDSQVMTSIICQVAQAKGATVVIVNHSANGKSLVGRIAIKLNAGSISGANKLPNTGGSFSVAKSVYSGKAVAHFDINTTVKVISLMGNSVPPEVLGTAVSVENVSVNIPQSRITVKSVKTVDGVVPLPEAELVVSAGRGMKEPGNWGIIEDLATTLGATTACSRPVADADWRPHHEHVGQTGVAIRPNLYIAIGISGAIQHLAGVNNSRVIVVINKDPEAPFFKAADYGVVGDLFEIVPRLNEALKKYKGH